MNFEDFSIEVPYGRHGNYKTVCPECSHLRRNRRDRCLSVQVDEGIWNCHNCGWRGSLGKGPEAFPLGARPQRVYAKPVEQPPYAPLTALSEKATQFFIDRGIDLETVERHGITGDDRAIKFPYYRASELVNVKTRYAGKQFSMEADCELILWGLDDCLGAEQVVVVEGELDKLACETAGLPHVLSVPNGAQPGGKLDYLASGESIFAGCHTVILAGDADEPGQALVEELARRIGRERCYRVTWPEGCKDANDVLLQQGDDVLRMCIALATPFPLPGIQTTQDIRADALALYRNGRVSGVSTGWRSLDAYYTVKTGQLTIVTGVPGSGKSEWLDAVMLNLTRKNDWPFAVFSPENFPAAHHISKLAEYYFHMPCADGPTPRMTEDEFSRFLEWAYERIQLINVEEPDLDTVLELARQLVFRLGIKGLIIDPWNEVEHSRPDHLTETEYVSECLGRLRRFARHYDLHVFVVAHPKKMYRDKDGDVPVPTPYDISGSANWFNKADNCITVSRDKLNEGPVDIHVQKIRFKEIGTIGIAQLHYDRVTGCFSDRGYR